MFVSRVAECAWDKDRSQCLRTKFRRENLMMSYGSSYERKYETNVIPLAVVDLLLQTCELLQVIILCIVMTTSASEQPPHSASCGPTSHHLKYYSLSNLRNLSWRESCDSNPKASRLVKINSTKKQVHPSSSPRSLEIELGLVPLYA